MKINLGAAQVRFWQMRLELAHQLRETEAVGEVLADADVTGALPVKRAAMTPAMMTATRSLKE